MAVQNLREGEAVAVVAVFCSVNEKVFCILGDDGVMSYSIIIAAGGGNVILLQELPEVA